jgi:hypothetical protein
LLCAQSSAAVFDAPVVVGGDYTRFMNVLDLDGDGWEDALSVWYPVGTIDSIDVRGFRNDQTGRLVHVWTVTHQLFGSTLLNVDSATGDMNLDGKEDFVVSVGGTFYVYLSNGVQPPTLWVTTSAGGLPSSAIKMADFNGDGRADIAAVTFSGLSILLTQPSGAPFPMSTLGLPAGTDHSLFLAEVNGDGTMDVGVAGFSTGTQLRLYPIVGGILQPPVSFTLPFETMPMPAAGDVDNDGDQDIVVFGMSSYRILRRTGPTTFNLEFAVPGGPATALADVDQDGDLDGVCCGGGGGDAPPNYYNSNYEIAINSGGGAFASAFTMTGLGSTRIAGAVDLDGDGDLELVAGRCVYYPDGPITKSPFTAVPGANTTRSVIDVDLDGDPDLQGFLGTAIAFSRNNGDGLIAPAPLLLPAPPAGSVWVGPGWPGDWDGDGDVDLVVVQQTTGGAFMAMRLLRNNSGGGYTDGGSAAAAGVDMRVMPATPIPVPMSPDYSLAADIDLDGDLDLVCRASSGYYIGSRTWLNSGGGFFYPGQELPGNYVVAIAPLDANATPDFLGVFGASSTGVGPLRLCRGLGGGAIAGPDAPITALSTWWNDCALADLDGDGDLDLATLNANLTFVGRNDGNGVFTPASPAFVQLVENLPFSPQHAAFVDVDLDGYLDVVVGPVLNTGSVGTAIHRGTATPWVFQPKTVQILNFAALTDADGDGDRDALASKLTRNRLFRQPDSGLRRQYGNGLAGSGGMAPVLGAVGPFRVGVSGDTRIRGGLGGAHAFFGIGSYETSTPILGGTLYTEPIVIFEFDLLGDPGVPGAGWVNLPWTLGPGLVGTPFYQQVGLIDPGAPQGASLTNALHSVIGP